jgi:hypothetical protein
MVTRIALDREDRAPTPEEIDNRYATMAQVLVRQIIEQRQADPSQMVDIMTGIALLDVLIYRGLSIAHIDVPQEGLETSPADIANLNDLTRHVLAGYTPPDSYLSRLPVDAPIALILMEPMHTKVFIFTGRAEGREVIAYMGSNRRGYTPVYIEFVQFYAELKAGLMAVWILGRAGETERVGLMRIRREANIILESLMLEMDQSEALPPTLSGQGPASRRMRTLSSMARETHTSMMESMQDRSRPGSSRDTPVVVEADVSRSGGEGQGHEPTGDQMVATPEAPPLTPGEGVEGERGHEEEAERGGGGEEEEKDA